jgi:hypothetical protein
VTSSFGEIYTSTDSGANWTQTGAPGELWTSVASSADGTHLVAVSTPNDVVSGVIYTSTDGGGTWTAASAPSEQWQFVASSADGTHLVVVINGGGIYTLAPQTAIITSGSQGSSEQFQYVGNGVWQPVQQNGTWSVSGTSAYYNAGNVGIGTASPQQSLSVAGGLNIDQGGQNSGTITTDALTFGSFSGEGIASERVSNGSQYDLEFYTDFNNRIEILNNGNVGIGNTSPGNLLVVGNSGSPAYCDGTTWVNGSDRNSKEAFAAINPRAVLEKVSALPITEWKYKVEADGKRHLGPVAQDFHAAFGLNGADDKHIATVDEEGVALAAIQGLNQKVEEKEARIQELSADMKAQQVENAELKARLEKLEELVSRHIGGAQ